MALTACISGTKGRFKASGREFIIVNTTPMTSTIRYRYTRQVVEVPDSELRELADDGWADEEKK